MNKKIFLILLILFPFSSRGQEFNCTVSVMAPQIQNIDQKVFQTLQQSIYEFMNNQKWTGDKYLNQERIEWTILITVNERISNDEFKGSIQVQSRRPIYQTSYNSPLFNYNDENFQFKYVEFQPLEFNESGSNTNLTAVLAFYAYLILGVDYDTFSLYGGSQYFAKAQQIASNMQNAQEQGWKAFEGTRNRYWLAENINNPVFKPYHEMMYNYHRKGLDVMAKKKEDAISVITESIESLQGVHQEKPGNVLFQTLFYAKADELVNIFSGAFPEVKVRASNVLNEIDPANTSKYSKILAN